MSLKKNFFFTFRFQKSERWCCNYILGKPFQSVRVTTLVIHSISLKPYSLVITSVATLSLFSNTQHSSYDHDLCDFKQASLYQDHHPRWPQAIFKLSWSPSWWLHATPHTTSVYVCALWVGHPGCRIHEFVHSIYDGATQVGVPGLLREQPPPNHIMMRVT